MICLFLRIFLSVVLGVFLFISPASAQKQVKHTKVASLRSSHKVAPAKAKIITGKHKGRAKTGRKVALKKFKKELTQPYYSEVNVPLELQRKLTCRSACIMDANTGRVLYNRSADKPGQPASTIKIITGLIAVESLNGKEMVRTSAYAANMPASKINLKKGVFYQASDLINAVLLASANDASVALAEKLAGSEQAFARLMTKKAEALGAQNTICKSANGLTRPGQQTTARDLAMVFNRAMHNAEFAERMTTTQALTSDGKVLRSHNKALWTLDGAVAGKTGYTVAAGKTYVGKFQRNGRAIIVSLMGSASMWDDVATLVAYGFNKQEMASLLPDDATDDLLGLHNDEKNMAQENAGYVVLAGQKKKTIL